MVEKRKVYPVSSYGKYLCLVPDFNMWLIFLFLIRPYVILIISFANRNDRMQLINLLYTDKIMMSFGALAGIPAAFVIYAWVKREPGASKFVTNIWHRGRLLLATSAIFNAGLAFAPVLIRGVHKLGIHGWWQLAGSLLALGMVLKSGYIKDCFLDFPQSEHIDK